MSTSPFFFKAFLGNNGRPAASGWLFAYAAGSSTLKGIFADRNNTIPLANPMRLDGNGVAPQFFTEAGLYDFKAFEYNFVTPLLPGPSCFTAEDIDGESGGGGGPSYVLPIATETILGGVKPDGATTFVDPVTGVLSFSESPKPESVLTIMDFGAAVPTSPFVGDKHVVNYNQPAPFDSHPNEIATWDGSEWEFRVPRQFEIVWNWNSTFYNAIRRGFAIFTGVLWAPCNTQDVVAETALINQVLLQDYSHPNKYLQIDGGFLFTQKGVTPGVVFEGPTAENYAALTSIADDEISVRGFQGVAPVDEGTYKDFRARKISARRFQVDTTSPDTTAVVGSTFWDADAKTIATHVENGSTLQHGQELVLYARNASGSDILDGQCVYITGASGNKCTIALADNDNRTASHIIAVATQNIANNADGYVTLAGRVNDIDTSAFAEGAEVWLGDAPGSLVATLPSGASVRARVGYVIRSHATQGALEVSINRFPFFSELSGNGVTTRTTTSATSAPTRFVRYTGTGGDTEPLPTASTISVDRYYRNSGTGPWTIQRAGTDTIDPGNPAAPVTSVTLLPGQTLHIYVALLGLWEAF